MKSVNKNLVTERRTATSLVIGLEWFTKWSDRELEDPLLSNILPSSASQFRRRSVTTPSIYRLMGTSCI